MHHDGFSRCTSQLPDVWTQGSAWQLRQIKESRDPKRFAAGSDSGVRRSLRQGLECDISYGRREARLREAAHSEAGGEHRQVQRIP